MTDFNLKVGIDTTELRRERKAFENLAGAGSSGTRGKSGGSAQESKSVSIIGKGVSRGLKLAGIVGIIASLSIISDSIGVLVGLIAFFVVGGIMAFFKDPVRALIPLGLFIINGFIAGLELLAEKIVPGDQNFDFGRFQTPLVLEAYDEFRANIQKAKEDGNLSVSEMFDAAKTFSTGFANAFMTSEQYANFIEGRATGLITESISAYDENENYLTILNDGAIGLADKALDVFNAIGRKYDELNQEVGGRVSSIASFEDPAILNSRRRGASFEQFSSSNKMTPQQFISRLTN